MFATTRMALLIGGAIGGATFPLFAQETTKNDTVIVTSPVQSGATRLATPDIETPQSVSIITRQQFEEQGATSVRQAVSYTPGVYSNQIGASNRFDYIVLRGFSDGSLDNVYLDGLKMMGDTNSHSSLVVDPWFLEDIEVVRGPASVLYGRSSPGGIVSLTSRKPAFDAGGEVKLFAGNNNQRGAAFDVTGPLDDNERVAARLSGMTRYADSQFTPLKEERYALMPSLTWRITDRTRLDLMAYLHRDPQGGSHSGLPYQGTVVPYNGGKISNTFFEGEDDYDKYDRRENMVGYNIEHLFDNGSYVMENVLFKISFPAEFHSQTAVEAAMTLYEQMQAAGKTAADIEKVTIRTHEACLRIIDKKGPLNNPADRDHCIQYMVAVPLLFGRLTAADYEDEVAQDKRIDALREKIVCYEDPAFTADYHDPEKRAIGNAITVEFTDGSRFGEVVVEYPIGHARRRADGIPKLIEKFKINLARQFPTRQQQRILDVSLDRARLEQMPVNEYLDLYII